MTTHSILPITLDSTSMLNGKEASSAIHRAIEGSHGLGAIDISDVDVTAFEWDDDQPAVPMGQSDVEKILRKRPDANHITIVLTVDKDEYLDFVRHASLEMDEYDFVHDRAFDFGITNNSEIEILGVSGSDFIVKYTSDIRDQIEPTQEG